MSVWSEFPITSVPDDLGRDCLRNVKNSFILTLLIAREDFILFITIATLIDNNSGAVRCSSNYENTQYKLWNLSVRIIYGWTETRQAIMLLPRRPGFDPSSTNSGLLEIPDLTSTGSIGDQARKPAYLAREQPVLKVYVVLLSPSEWSEFGNIGLFHATLLAYAIHKHCYEYKQIGLTQRRSRPYLCLSSFVCLFLYSRSCFLSLLSFFAWFTFFVLHTLWTLVHLLLQPVV